MVHIRQFQSLGEKANTCLPKDKINRYLEVYISTYFNKSRMELPHYKNKSGVIFAKISS